LKLRLSQLAASAYRFRTTKWRFN